LVDVLPTEGITVKDVALKLWRPQYQKQPRRIRQINELVRKALSGESFPKPRDVKSRANLAGMNPLPDEVMEIIERNYADHRASRVRGNVDKEIQALKEAGVRQSILDATKVEGAGYITRLVKVKRTQDGLLSGSISKATIRAATKAVKAAGGGNQGGWAKKYSAKWLKYYVKEGLFAFEVPQQFFKRIGLLDFAYEPVRIGERAGGTFFRTELEPEVDRIYEGMELKERMKVQDYLAAKQGFGEDMRAEGITPPKWDDLNPRQKKAVREEREFIKRWSPKILAESKLQGAGFTHNPNYAPMYVSKDMEKMGGEGAYYRVARNTPWFRSLVGRKEDVPYKLYERDPHANLHAFSLGMANFLKVGPRTMKTKFFLESDEIKALFDPATHGHIMDWYKSIVNPQRGSKALAFLRKAGYRTYLGLNPGVILKQGISYSDMAIIEDRFLKGKIPEDIEQLISTLDLASAKERLPSIAVVDMDDKIDRAMLKGIVWADKGFAGGALTRMLAAELKFMQEQGINIHSNKVLRQALNRMSDRLDLGMMGVTRAQRPPVFRTELGKLALMFNSTINSRFQYYLEEGVFSGKGTKEGWTEKNYAKIRKDLYKMARILGAFFLGAYLEVSISNLSPTRGDAKRMMADILKAGIGNIPGMGALVYAVDLGKDWNPSAVIGNVNDAIKTTKKYGIPSVQGLLSLGELMGVPKQFRKTYDGILTVLEGKRVSKGKYIKPDDPIEIFRALVKGQYGPHEVKEYFESRDAKTDMHKRIGKKIAKVKDQQTRKDLSVSTTKLFRENWDYIMSKLPENDRKYIERIFEVAKKRGIKLSPTSILNQIKANLEK